MRNNACSGAIQGLNIFVMLSVAKHLIATMHVVDAQFTNRSFKRSG